MAEAIMADGFKGISESLMGRHYISRIPAMSPVEMLVYEVQSDFSYNHTDQDIRHGVYNFKKGEVIALRADEEPMYFMPDRSNLKQLGRWYKESGQQTPKKGDWRIIS